jgi:hypothetical protein
MEIVVQVSRGGFGVAVHVWHPHTTTNYLTIIGIAYLGMRGKVIGRSKHV